MVLRCLVWSYAFLKVFLFIDANYIGGIVWTSLFSSYMSVLDGIKIVVLTVAVLTVAVLSVTGIKSRRYQMSRY